MNQHTLPVTKEQRAQVRQMNADDAELYVHAQALFQQRWKALGLADSTGAYFRSVGKAEVRRKRKVFRVERFQLTPAGDV